MSQPAFCLSADLAFPFLLVPFRDQRGRIVIHDILEYRTGLGHHEWFARLWGFDRENGRFAKWMDFPHLWGRYMVDTLVDLDLVRDFAFFEEPE